MLLFLRRYTNCDKRKLCLFPNRKQNSIRFQVVEEFKLHAREKKFVVRDFTYNEEELAAGKNEITKLVTDKKKQFVSESKIYPLEHSYNNLFLLPLILGSTCQMVEGEFQRNLLRLDPC